MPKKWPLSYCSCVGRTGERGGGGAGGRSAGQQAYGGTDFTCLTGTNVLLPPAVRAEEELDKKYMEVLTLPALLVQMYFFHPRCGWKKRWTRSIRR